MSSISESLTEYCTTVATCGGAQKGDMNQRMWLTQINVTHAVLLQAWRCGCTYPKSCILKHCSGRSCFHTIVRPGACIKFNKKSLPNWNEGKEVCSKNIFQHVCEFQDQCCVDASIDCCRHLWRARFSFYAQRHRWLVCTLSNQLTVHVWALETSQHWFDRFQQGNKE